jgi:plastocyanin
VACAALASSAWGGATRGIKIGDNYYVKDGKAPTVIVSAKTRVTWHWTGHAPHNVTVSHGPTKFHSETQTSGTYSRLMTRKGTYKIFCTIHGAKDQSMTLVVR